MTLSQDVITELMQDFLKQGVTDFSKLLTMLEVENPDTTFLDGVEIALFLDYLPAFKVYHQILISENHHIALPHSDFLDLVGNVNSGTTPMRKLVSRKRKRIEYHINMMLNRFDKKKMFIAVPIGGIYKAYLFDKGTANEVHQQLISVGVTSPTTLDLALSYC